MSKKPKILITIPAYNEEKTLGPVIDDINKVMSKTKYNYVVHVLDDGSRDKTIQVAKKHGAKVNSNSRNLGLAETFKNEMQRCLEMKADIIVHTDADGQYLASDIPALIKKLEEGYDLVLGSRFAGRIESMPFMKRMGNKAFAYVLSKLTKVKLTDTTTGFRAFTSDVAREIKFINTFTYTQEQIIKAAKMKFKLAEVPISARKTRSSRLFKSPIEYAIKAWVNILRIYRDFDPLKFFGAIGLVLMLIGIVSGSILTGFYLTGRIDIDRHIPTLLLAVLFFMTGLQILLFGFLADKYGK